MPGHLLRLEAPECRLPPRGIREERLDRAESALDNLLDENYPPAVSFALRFLGRYRGYSLVEQADDDDHNRPRCEVLIPFTMPRRNQAEADALEIRKAITLLGERGFTITGPERMLAAANRFFRMCNCSCLQLQQMDYKISI